MKHAANEFSHIDTHAHNHNILKARPRPTLNDRCVEAYTNIPHAPPDFSLKTSKASMFKRQLTIKSNFSAGYFIVSPTPHLLQVFCIEGRPLANSVPWLYRMSTHVYPGMAFTIDYLRERLSGLSGISDWLPAYSWIEHEIGIPKVVKNSVM